MANHGPDSAFYDTMNGLQESVKESLPLELRILFGRADVADAAACVKILSKFLKLSAQPCSAKVKIAVGNAILDKSHPVDLFFSCLPDLRGHEMRYVDTGWIAVVEAYDQAHEVLKYFAVVHGRDKLKKRYKSAILNRLFKIWHKVDRCKAGSNDTFLTFNQWTEHLLRLAWETPPTAAIQQRYTAHTHSLIQYMRWIIRGRKDAFCNVHKPWTPVNPADLRKRAREDLRHLPYDALSRVCAYCCAGAANIRCLCCWLYMSENHATATVYCSHVCRELDSEQHAVSRQEIIELSRLTILFQIVFNQYLLSTNYGVSFTVSEQDGIVIAVLSGPTPSGFDPETTYEGTSPNLDLSLQKVETALHAFGCCAIKGPAGKLLEYFFRSSSRCMEFLDFVPKNAHTSVMQHDPMDVSGRATCRPNMSPMHTVAVLRTRSGHQFILDPTAAQYGWKENLAPQQTYTRCRIDHIFRKTECLAPISQLPPTERTPRPEDEYEQAIWRCKCVAENTVDLTKDQFSENGGLLGVLQLPQAQFEEQCRTLKENLKLGMSAHDRYRASDLFQQQ